MEINACYDPFHTNEARRGSQKEIKASLDQDFQLMAKNIKAIRTYHAQVRGVDIVPFAAKYNIQVYLGIMMRNDFNAEVEAVVRSVKAYPQFIKAIFVGNENCGPKDSFKPDDILARINMIKGKLGPSSIPVGTVQRVGDFIDGGDAFQRLAQSCGIIGINIYPFFDKNYNHKDPADLFHRIWIRLSTKYGNQMNKFVVTETGYATGGGDSPAGVKSNLQNSMAYYNGLKNYIPTVPMKHSIFWFSFFDRMSDDNTNGGRYEQHFGLFKWNRERKDANFPLPNPASSPSTANNNIEPQQPVLPISTAPIQPQHTEQSQLKLTSQQPQQLILPQTKELQSRCSIRRKITPISTQQQSEPIQPQHTEQSNQPQQLMQPQTKELQSHCSIRRKITA